MAILRIYLIGIILFVLVAVGQSQTYRGADGYIHIRNADSSMVADTAQGLSDSLSSVLNGKMDSTRVKEWAILDAAFLTEETLALEDSGIYATQYDISTFITSGSLAPYIDSVRVHAITDSLAGKKLNIADSTGGGYATQYDISLKLNSADTSGTAYRTWVSSLFNPYIDSARTHVLFDPKMDSVRVKTWAGEYVDTSKIVFWADSSNELATNYDVSLKENADATLTDIADGTIAENLVNTSNPWADNEIASSATWNAKMDDSDSTTFNATKTNIDRRAYYEGYILASTTADAYLKNMSTGNMSSTAGFVAMRAGSITGIAFQVNASAVTTPGTIKIAAMLDGVDVFSETTGSISGTGRVNDYGVQVKGTDTFIAGQILSIYLDFLTFVGTINYVLAEIEVTYDN